MKTKILLTAMLFHLVSLGIGSMNAANSTASDETIKIYVAPDTRALVESWTTDYLKTNPEVTFEIKAINYSEFNDELGTGNSLGFFIKSPDISMFGESIWRMVVGHNVIVPVINSDNPFAATLKANGVSANELSGLIKNANSPVWGALLKNSENTPVHLYISNEAEVLLSVSNFLDIDPIEIKSLETKAGNEIQEMLRNDKYAIGFCRLADVIDAETNDFGGNINLLPIDRNGNGKLDFNENYFDNLESFERAVWIGKYPKSLIYNVYALSESKPENETVTGFLSWIVTAGQEMVTENGFSELVFNEAQSNLTKLNPAVRFTPIAPEAYSQTKIIILEVIAFGLMVFFLVILFFLKGKSNRKLSEAGNHQNVLNEESIVIPPGLFFDKTHTWVFMEKDGTVKVGIDDFLQHVTGDYTGIIMKAPGEKLLKNEPVVTLINEGKKINIYAPVSGTIKEINEDLVDYPSLINSSPYAWGWIYTIEPANWFREISFLKMADTYKEWIKKEFIRLKDFLASVNQNQMPDEQLVYQEGGELHDHVLHDFNPKVWEEFQVRFIDTSDMN